MTKIGLGVRARVYDKHGTLKTDTGWKENKLPSLKAQIRVKDLTGRILSTGKWRECDSFVIQFLELLYRQASQLDPGGGVLSVTNIVNAEDGSGESDATFQMDGAAGDDELGIVVGTDNTAEDTDQYALISRIDHGGAAGELQYSVQGFTAPAVVGANIDLLLSRTFTNNSGGNITIEEVGIYCYGFARTAGDTHMILRDLHNLTINDGLSRVIEIIFRTTVEGFVIQFLELLYRHLAQSAYTVTRITGAEDVSAMDSDTFTLGWIGEEETHGIVLGTDNTAVTNEDYVLGTKIAHGVGAGQLLHGSQQSTIPTEIAGNVEFILTKTFTNGSGGGITVEEIGIYATGDLLAIIHLITRHLLNFAIANGDAATVDIRMRTTV